MTTNSSRIVLCEEDFAGVLKSQFYRPNESIERKEDINLLATEIYKLYQKFNSQLDKDEWWKNFSSGEEVQYEERLAELLLLKHFADDNKNSAKFDIQQYTTSSSTKNDQAGPDFLLTTKEHEYIVEVTAPFPLAKLIGLRPDNSFDFISDREIAIKSVVGETHKKQKKYENLTNQQKRKGFIICLFYGKEPTQYKNSALCINDHVGAEMLNLPLTFYGWTYDVSSSKILSSENKIISVKHDDEEVDEVICPFFNNKTNNNESISAVLLSFAPIWSLFDCSEKLKTACFNWRNSINKNDFHLIHNPHANVKLPHNLLPVNKEIDFDIDTKKLKLI